MTATTGNTHSHSPAVQARVRHILLCDDLGYLTLQRLRPWHRMLARCAAARLDRELAAGASPESSAARGARAMQLTSVNFRRDLAASLQRILAASRGPARRRGLADGRRPSAANLAAPGADQPVGGAARQAGRLPGVARPGPGAGGGDGQPAAGRRRGPALQ
jgi:hypothetical protein